MANIKPRKELPTDDLMGVITGIAEGNPGGFTAAMLIFEKAGPIPLLILDDMNIRGTQIWVGYKDVCGGDLDLFLEKITARDDAMIEAINEEGRRGNHPFLAVKHGASFKSVRPMIKEDHS
jgi:hypothetical protein